MKLGTIQRYNHVHKHIIDLTAELIQTNVKKRGTINNERIVFLSNNG